MMVKAPGLKGMSNLVWATAIPYQLGMYRIAKVVERESLCKHT